MKAIKIIGLLVIVLLFTACDKDKTHILKGRLVYNCDKTPVPDTEVELKVTNKYRYYGTSDKNGYFSIVYEKGNIGLLRINKVKILDGVPLQIGKEKENDIGDVYVGGTIDLIVKLQVNNPHTENDTLIFGI